MQAAQVPSAIDAAAGASRLMLERVYALAVAAAHAQEQPAQPPEPESTVTYALTPPVTVAAATPIAPITSGGVWACIANAETGGDVSMHGPVYSTAFGMINDIIYEYASPEVQAKVFSGTASFSEELDIAVRFANDHGFGGWGVLTKQKCGL